MIMSVKYVLSRKVKTHGIISAVAASLFLFSAGVLAENKGPACVFPDDKLSAAEWAKAQDKAGGHMDTCHIAKSDQWLVDRTNGPKDGCTKAGTATTWENADVMWKYIGQTIRTFCAAKEESKSSFEYQSLPLDDKTTPVEVGRGYDAGGAFVIKNNGKAYIKLVKKNQLWHVQTSYPQQ